MSPKKSDGRLSDRAYQLIRSSIVSGEFRPNQRLVETELAERFAISRTPVRDGLQRLFDEGLVGGGKHGWIVHEHTIEEITEIYEARAAMEGYAVRLAAERLTDEELDEIERIQRSLGDHWAEVDRIEVVGLNARFHQAILDGARNRRLITLIDRNRDFYFNHRVAERYTEEHVERSREGHDQIILALRARDADRAEQLTREHIFQGLEVIRATTYRPS